MTDYDYMEADVQRAAIKWFREQCPDEKKIVYLGEQVYVGIGYIDFLFFQVPSSQPIVFEVKRGKAPKTALSQLLAYMGVVERCIHRGIPYGEQLPNMEEIGIPYGFLVAESLDDMTARAIKYFHRVIFVQYKKTDRGFTFERHYQFPKVEIDSYPLDFMRNELKKCVIEMNSWWPRSETLDSYHGEQGGYYPRYTRDNQEFITVWNKAK